MITLCYAKISAFRTQPPALVTQKCAPNYIMYGKKHRYCHASPAPTPFLYDILYERSLITSFRRFNHYVSFLRPLWRPSYSTKHFSNNHEQLIITQYRIWYILIFISFITQWSANATLPTTYKDQRVVSFFCKIVLLCIR